LQKLRESIKEYNRDTNTLNMVSKKSFDCQYDMNICQFRKRRSMSNEKKVYFKEIQNLAEIKKEKQANP
jgi:t-SNARE complex subunit (syntaxin)